MPSTAHVPSARRWPRLLRLLRARPRLWLSLLAGLAVWAGLPHGAAQHESTRILIGWNVGALAYSAFALWMMLHADHAQIRKRALHQDDGRLTVLALAAVASLAVLLAVASQLAELKDMHGWPRTGHAALAGLTVFAAWLFIQTTFALHYAHDFYLARVRGDDDALQFPGTPDPDYADFLYFSCVIGTSGQTADVSFTGRAMRRIGTLHCVLAYFFNATVLALTINIAAGLF